MARVIIEVSGVKNADGIVTVGLFEERGFKRFGGEAVHRQSVDAASGSVELVFDGVAPGAWAAGAYHDENRNGRLDLTMGGTAAEGRGYSNVARPGLRAPTFEEARFAVGEGGVQVDLALRYPHDG